MLVRTWNLFHGNTKPPSRRAFLEAAVRLAVADAPDVVCLQELPAWSLPKLAAWSGYSVDAGARRPAVDRAAAVDAEDRADASRRFIPASCARRSRARGTPCSPRRGLELREQQVCVLNPLGLPARAGAVASARACGAHRVGEGGARVPGRAHGRRRADVRSSPICTRRAIRRTSGSPTPSCCARSSTSTGSPSRARAIAVAGDFNVTFARSRTLLDVSGDEWGFSRPGTGHRPRARAEPAHHRRADALAGRAARARLRDAVRSHARRRGRRMTFDEARALFPVLERVAYLNAGTFGPLARQTIAVDARAAASATSSGGEAASRTSTR